MKDVDDIETLKAIWEQNRPAIAAQPGYLFMYHFQGVDDPAEIRAITAWRTYEDASNSHNEAIMEMINSTAGPYYISSPTSDIWETEEVDVEVLHAQLTS